MKFNDIHPVYRQAIGCHEAFRKLGFPSEEIFVLYQGGDSTLFVTLESQGKKFNVAVGRMVLTQGQFEKDWGEITTKINDGTVSQADLDAIWQDSMPAKDSTGFLLALYEKGIQVPKTMERHRQNMN